MIKTRQERWTEAKLNFLDGKNYDKQRDIVFAQLEVEKLELLKEIVSKLEGIYRVTP